MTGTTFYTRTGGNYSTTLYMTYQVTGQSVAGNYSDLTIRAYIKYSGGTKTSSSQSSGYFILNGTTVASNATYSISSGGEHLFGSVSKRVYHNSNGTFPATSISYSCKNYHFGTTSGTGTISAGAVAQIARASSISVGDSTGYYCGSSAKFTISRADSSFTHELYYQLPGGSWTHFQTGATTSGSLSIPTSWESSYMASATYMDFAIYCETYSNGNYVGTTSCSCRAVVRTSSVYSISSVSASEAASEMTALNWGVYVAGHSKIKFTVSYSNNSNGASIKSIYWDFNYQASSGTSNTWTTSTLQYGSTSGQAHTLTVKITDSRGRTATKTFSYTVYSVSAPSITSSQIGRCTSAGVLDNDGTAVKINSTYTAASTCNGKNTTARKALYKLSTASTWTSLGAVTSDSVTFTSVTFDVEKSYDVKVVAYDTFSESEGLTRLGTASNFIQLRSDEKGIALGKYSEKKGLEVNWTEWHYKKETHSGAVTINNTLTANVYKGGQSGTWTPTSTESSMPFSAADGIYYKIGRMVFVKGYISISASSSSTGAVCLTGLPFTAAQEAVLPCGYGNLQAYTTYGKSEFMDGYAGWFVNSGSKNAFIKCFKYGRVWGQNWNTLGTGDLVFSGCYLTDE